MDFLDFFNAIPYTNFMVDNSGKIRKLLEQKRNDIYLICEKYGARNIRIFGSVARSQADAESDIDFLVDLEPGRTLLDLGGLQYELEKLLGVNVDVVTEHGLKRRIKDQVLKEAITL